MNTEKIVFNKLFKDTVKTKLSNKKANLGIAQDLEGAVFGASETLNTGDKLVDIAIKVNNEIEKLTEDVRYYNKYISIIYDDLNNSGEYLKELMQKAENVSEQLGTDVNDIVGYEKAKNTLLDIQKVSGRLTTHTLNFDI